MPTPLKPLALRPGDAIRAIAPASPVEAAKFEKGINELQRLGYKVVQNPRVFERDGYFAGSAAHRTEELLSAIREKETRAIFCARGGYGSTYLLDQLSSEVQGLKDTARPKLLVGYSDITASQVFLWEKCGWITIYGPMVAAGLDDGADAPGGYDRESLEHALTETKSGWNIELAGETLSAGAAEGVLLGGCLTLLVSTLGTPWAINTHDSILLLEDRAMKPWQIDRALMHLKQAGELDGVRGLIFGDFPECEAPAGSPTVRDVIERVTGHLGIPVVWNVPFGHTARPMLTLPLGTRARLKADGASRLEILEAACVAD
jgi:muramoyltetrapeptide carboxypeptidase